MKRHVFYVFERLLNNSTDDDDSLYHSSRTTPNFRGITPNGPNKPP